MSRTAPPDRREGYTLKMVYTSGAGQEMKVYATCNIGPDGKVFEVFGATSKAATDMRALIKDGCIAISLLLQYGMALADIADAFGEDRPEGGYSGPASSVIGMIARSALALERDICGALVA